MAKYLHGTNYSMMMTFDDDEPHIVENVFVRAGLIIVYCFVFTICFFGNLAVILVLLVGWKRRSVSKFCLGSMAVANFSVSVFCILENLTFFLVEAWIIGEFACKIYHFITNLCHVASILMAVLISIERYVVLLHSLRSRQFLTTRKLLLTILGVWLLSAGISLPRLFYSGMTQTKLNETGDFVDICVPIKSMCNSPTVDTLNFLIMYLIPLVIMSALYLRIGLFLRRKERRRRSLDEENASVQTSPGPNQIRSRRKQLDDLQIVASRSMREVHSHSTREDLSSLSKSSEEFTEGFRGQILPQQDNTKSCVNMKELAKWSNHLTHPLCLESTEEAGVQLKRSIQHYWTAKQDTGELENVCRPFIPEKTVLGGRKRCYKVRRYVSGGFIADTRGSHSTATSLSTIQRGTAIAINPEAHRFLYRYNRFRLSHVRVKQRKSVVRTFILIVVTFAMLNLPYHLGKLCPYYLPSIGMAKDTNNLIAALTFVLMYANCAVNPILYAFLSKNFRANLKDFFFGRGRNPVGV